jgi:hypothetical protein
MGFALFLRPTRRSRYATVSERDVIPCRQATAGSAHQVKGLGRRGPRHQEITMPKYLLLKLA